MDYKTKLSKWAKRREEMTFLYHEKGLTAAVIAKQYKVTTQRVYQQVGIKVNGTVRKKDRTPPSAT